MKRIQSILLAFLIVFLTACEKDTEATNFAPEVITGSATSIYRKGATLAGSINLTGTATAESYGILFSEFQSMGEYTEYPISSGETDYEVKVQNLLPGKTYYYCAYANSGYSIARGEINSFNTTENNPPVFDEIVVSNVEANHFTVTVTMLDDGGATPIISGFCWREGSSGVPTLIDHVVNVSNIEGNQFAAEISGLRAGTDYVVSAYSVNSKGMGFSEGVKVTTDGNVIPNTQKKLIRIEGFEDELKDCVYNFTYNNDSINKIVIDYYLGNNEIIETEIYNINYMEDGTLRVTKEFYDGEYSTLELSLNELGFIASCNRIYDDGRNETCFFEYNDEGQCIKVSDNDNLYQIVYENSNAVKVEFSGLNNGYTDFLYGEQENISSLFLLDEVYDLDNVDDLDFFGMIGMLGKPSKNLPISKVGFESYDWSLDSDGYPDKIYVIFDDDGYSYVTNFIWE